MKKTKLTLLVSTLAVVFSAASMPAHSFGLGNLTAALPGSASASSVSAGDVDAFIQTAKEAELLIDKAADHIFKALANKEEVAKYEAALKAAEEIKDVKEREAKINQIQADRDVSLQKTMASKETESKVKAMNTKQLANFSNAGFTFMLGLLKDRQLADGSANLVSGVAANPMLAGKLLALKDTASSVANQVQSASKIGEGLVKLAKVGNINIMPASASDKAKAIEVM
jgi:hypothetical protein